MAKKSDEEEIKLLRPSRVAYYWLMRAIKIEDCQHEWIEQKNYFKCSNCDYVWYH